MPCSVKVGEMDCNIFHNVCWLSLVFVVENECSECAVRSGLV